MNIFLDTNVFLSFYRLSDDDIEELRKLSALLVKDTIKLYIPEQVVSEFDRNRDNKIAEAVDEFKKQRLDFAFPAFIREYSEWNEMRELQKKYSILHRDLLKKVEEDIQSRNLAADKIIQELFNKGIKILQHSSIVESSKLRVALGNPPGKNGSLGDAINWESLLQEVSSDEPLHFISRDRDFSSPIGKDRFNSYLLEEWKQAKQSDLVYYTKLSDFFKKNFPDIRLASELDREILIQRLSESSCFKETHEIIENLNQYSDFTNEEVDSMIFSAISNDQIYRIIRDSDVKNFCLRIIKGRDNDLNREYLDRLNSFLKDPFEDDDFFPF
ncbi:hypothetical protein AMR42_05785 [Limnothrix sp. PR1529]|uniref:PIN domain-containing protein n=1 Tax=Limnothrix sp. PR1529 TaxID=1704291 RepID=UPI00081E5DCF|nr:PIN domain-containing protein [Limnothrix sp. PR1529]OCQ95177.1 hypothetical protein BCR12_07270 [Limnothrix sp. P13C2]PIB14436.1 hypothetical protein AMR42_05785 [Limnothrix sp. PR1529]